VYTPRRRTPQEPGLFPNPPQNPPSLRLKTRFAVFGHSLFATPTPIQTAAAMCSLPRVVECSGVWWWMGYVVNWGGEGLGKAHRLSYPRRLLTTSRSPKSHRPGDGIKSHFPLAAEIIASCAYTLWLGRLPSRDNVGQ